MLIRRLFLISVLIFLAAPRLFSAEEQKPEESDQQINDFNLVGYGEKGKKSWDLAGKTDDINTEVVKLTDVNGNLYGKEEDVNLIADKGDFNKIDGKVHLQDNVVITTTSGTKLTTDSLDYDRKNQHMTTEDIVNIERENLRAVGRGAEGQTNLKQVALKKDVKLDVIPAMEKGLSLAQKEKEKIVITCDGPLEVDYEKNIAEFNKNVKVDREGSQIYSDIMFVYFIPGKKEEADPENKEADNQGAKTAETAQGSAEKKGGDSFFAGSSIDKIIARGNVKIVRGENTSYSDEAVYTSASKKIVLTGRPKLIMYSTEEMGDNAPFGG